MTVRSAPTVTATKLECETYTFDPRPRYELVTTAKRYWHPQHCSTDTDALTLVFAHGSGFVKEHWEPTLEFLYALLGATPAEQGKGGVRIREAWSIECPNHGDAAVLNEEVLAWGYVPVFGWDEYACVIHDILTGLGTGIDVDFSDRRLVGVGHSMGAIALMLADTYMPRITFSSLVLVEPMLLRKPPPGETDVDLETGAVKRRDVWASYEDALKSLQARPSFKVWNPRALEILVKHGMRDLPTALYPDKQGVTLKCTKQHEAACYRDALGRVRAYRYLATLCPRVPVHFIYGAIDDYVPREVKDDVLKVAARDKYATHATVEGAGHLVVQTQPAGLAQAIHNALMYDAKKFWGDTPWMSKL